MKKLFLFAAAALALTACTNEDELTQSAAQPVSEAISFDTYVPNAITKAGKVGVMNTDSLKSAKGGFGVFAQYSNDGTYNVSTGSNFMWNQKVTWNATSLGWEYSPLKYWPNETKQDSQNPNATMDTRVDRLTFFAYAPYVAHSATDGKLTGVTYTEDTPNNDQTGIIKVTGNDAATYPMVTYRVSPDPSETVDLLWGVAPAGGLSYPTVDPTYTAGDPASATLTVAEGLPLKDLIKPYKNQKMKFLFKHALSRINFTVVGAFDQIAAGGNKDANTKVLVDTVKVFEKEAGSIKTNGQLNLNNTAAGIANWNSRSGGDYRSTALFTVSGDTINATIKDGGAVDFATQPTGVTTQAVNLFKDSKNYFAVIPNNPGNANELTKFVVEITYYVQTKDAQLKATGDVDGSRVKNKVRVPVSIHLDNNKSYNFRLILGLTSVKLDAEVADWTDAGDVDAFLPQNAE